VLDFASKSPSQLMGIFTGFVSLTTVQNGTAARAIMNARMRAEMIAHYARGNETRPRLVARACLLNRARV
jgi:hypothetical protein